MKHGGTNEAHGSSIIQVVPCSIHPLHCVKVRANGSRSGCPMCSMQIEAICHAFKAPAPRDHAPMIAHDRMRIIGCTCGWRTPSGTTDSDDAYAAYATVLR
jgi:hypothetical protein